MGRLLAENLHVIEPTREMFAEYVDYDFATQQGELRNAQGVATVFYYNAEKIRINGPEDAVLNNVWVTTCPRPDPFYRILAKELTIRGGKEVTYFEFSTALAFLHFAACPVDVAVLEVGMGGRQNYYMSFSR